MRIVSGKFRGKRFSPPKSFSARPTTDVAKESLFNILENDYYMDEIRVLDLFSGTGSISYEFFSRGCNDVTAVELDIHHFKFIERTIAELKAEKNINLYKADAFKFVKKNSLFYDIIFADPPFDLPNLETLPVLIFENQHLKPEALLIIEHSFSTDFSTMPYFFKQKNYGKVNFSFFSKKQATQE